jgi:hypothetical protein
MDISDIDRVSRWRTLFRWAARPARPGQEPWRRLALRLQYETPNRDDSRSALLVTAGIIAEPAGHVAAERAGRLLEALQADHAMVLFCGGDIPANGFALALASVVGRVAVLAIENETTSEELEAAQESLRLRNARDIGLVLATRARVPA